MIRIILILFLSFPVALCAQTYQQLSEKAIEYIEMDSLSKAEELLLQALKLEPKNAKNAMLFSNLGLVQRRLGEYDKAYDIWLAIARDLEKDGYEVEKNYPFELAGRCREILEKKLQRFPENTAAPTE